MSDKNKDRNLKYNKNEKRVSDNYEKNNVEDATKYGEFIPSFYTWLPVEKQKEQTRELDNMTKNKKE